MNFPDGGPEELVSDFADSYKAVFLHRPYYTMGFENSGEGMLLNMPIRASM